jgi:hypothetical protein
MSVLQATEWLLTVQAIEAFKTTLPIEALS